MNDIPATLSSQDVEPIGEFIRNVQIRQHVNQSMDFFRQAAFMIGVVRMSEEDFELLCRFARQLAHRGCTALNASLETLPDAAREVAQELGMIPKAIDSTDLMRYISEAENDLRKLRKTKLADDQTPS